MDLTMIELLGAALLPWCTVVEDMWSTRIADCFEVAGQAASAGPDYQGLTADQPWVYIPSQYDADNPAGAIDLRIGPEPDSGYWMVGVVPACIRDSEDGTQSITKAGSGGLGEMFPGHYWSAPGGQPDPDDLDAGGWLLAFTDDPCLVPHTRAAAVYVGYSEEIPVGIAPPEWFNGGWDDFDNTSADGRFRYDVVADSWTYAGGGSITIQVTALNVSGWPNNSDAPQCWNAAGGTVACPTATGDPRFYQGWSPKVVGATKTYTYVMTSTQKALNFWGGVVYRPSGHPARDEGEETSEGYQGQSFLVVDDTFDDFIYIEPTREWVTMEGVCDTQECLDTYCDGISWVNLGELVSCWFRWDVEWSDWFDHVKHQVDQAPYVSMIRYTAQVLTSYPTAVRSLEGDCGNLADLSGTPIEGFNFDTCVLPHQVEFRIIAGAFIYISFVMFAWRSMSAFLQFGTAEEPSGVGGKSGAKGS